MTHTPGPWKAKFSKPIRVVTESDEVELHRLICDIFSDNKADDARLIAASPALLEAAKIAHDFLVGSFIGIGEDEPIRVLAAAIAQAEPGDHGEATP